MTNTNTAIACNQAIVTRDYQGMAFQFREDGFFNMTKAAKHFGKRLDNFMASPETQEYIQALGKNPEIQGVNRGQVWPLPWWHVGTSQAGCVLCSLAGREVRCLV